MESCVIFILGTNYLGIATLPLCPSYSIDNKIHLKCLVRLRSWIRIFGDMREVVRDKRVEVLTKRTVYNELTACSQRLGRYTRSEEKCLKNLLHMHIQIILV